MASLASLALGVILGCYTLQTRQTPKKLVV